jgi:hypothetical protein
LADVIVGELPFGIGCRNKTMARLTSSLLVLVSLAHILRAAPAPLSEMTGHRSPASRAELAVETQGEIEVWIDLSLPALSTLAKDQHEARATLRARIEEQQDDVMAQLIALGAKETARILHVRNSLAVRMPASALDEARGIAGVVNVRKVRHMQRHA